MRFSERETKLTMSQYFDLLKYLDKNLVVGVEMERPVPLDPSIVARHLESYRGKPSGEIALGLFKKTPSSKYNVAYCYHDGTVHCNDGNTGAEIVFGGTMESFKWIYARLKLIEDKLTKLNADDFDKSCSSHITVCTVHDQRINPVVVKNIIQITRAFSTALYWLGSGDKRTIVRELCGHNARPRLRESAIGEPFGNNSADERKYNLCNTSKQEHSGEELFGLMVEFRNIDGIRVPSALAALMQLYKAIVLKAVDLSLNGVVDVESIVDWELNKTFTERIIDPNVVAADKFTIEQKQAITVMAKQLITFVYPQLKGLSSESIEVLEKLADQPVSMRKGKPAAIDKQLYRNANNKFTDNEAKLIETVLYGSVKKDTATKWKQELATQLSIGTRMVEHMMERIEEKTGRRMYFEGALKTYVLY